MIARDNTNDAVLLELTLYEMRKLLDCVNQNIHFRMDFDTPELKAECQRLRRIAIDLESVIKMCDDDPTPEAKP